MKAYLYTSVILGYDTVNESYTKHNNHTCGQNTGKVEMLMAHIGKRPISST